MNKKTAKAILTVIQSSPSSDRFETTLDDSEAKGLWFFKLKFKVMPPNKSYLSHVESISMAIGKFFGEGLWVKYSEDKLELTLS
jgi:hypothetical protein